MTAGEYSVYKYNVAGGGIGPGGSVTVEIETTGGFRYLSAAGMLVSSNDAFFLPSGACTPVHGRPRLSMQPLTMPAVRLTRKIVTSSPALPAETAAFAIQMVLKDMSIFIPEFMVLGVWTPRNLTGSTPWQPLRLNG
jgi:hypothetical protein